MHWNTTMKLGPKAVLVLMTDENHNEILKARLPLQSIHPRAVTSLMEGLALWAGHPTRLCTGLQCNPQVTFALEGGAHAVGRHCEVEPLDDHALRVHARQRFLVTEVDTNNALSETDHGR